MVKVTRSKIMVLSVKTLTTKIFDMSKNAKDLARVHVIFV